MKAPGAIPPTAGFAVLAVAVLALVVYGQRTRLVPALADEFVYLAGAQHFSRTASLDARFYDARGILRQGYPHHDVHTPGYVLLLGTLMAGSGGGFATAVAFNVAVFLASALLVQRLTGLLFGQAGGAPMLAGLLYVLLPAYLAYVYWAMAEVLLGACLLAALVCATGAGDRTRGAVGAGVLFGLAFLVRESALFGLPALLGLLWRRGRIRAFVLASLVFVLTVYVPLSQHRAPGGANFWAPTSGTVFGFQAVRAGIAGDFGRALDLATARARSNLAEVVGPETPAVEKGILLLDLALPLWALSGWRRLTPLQRRYLAGLTLGLITMLAVLFGVYVVGEWSGFRYLMVLMPAYLPYVPGHPVLGERRWLAPMVTGAFCLWLLVGTLEIVNPYKESRHRRQLGIAAYVEKYVAELSVTRIALQNGWLYGLRHYPVEVISSLPQGGGELRKLEQAIAFDVLVLPGDSPLSGEMEARGRYRRLNADDAEAPLLVYQRLR